MKAYESAEQAWTRMLACKDTIMLRTERYAELTIPKVCLAGGLDTRTVDQSHDYQSIGAQAVNHLTNKIMLALFAPSRPFFRVQAGTKTLQELQANGVSETDVSAMLAKLERDAVRELDARAQRPKLYQVVRHLIVTGNVLLVLGKKDLRVMGMRYFCVKRDIQGKLLCLVVKETLSFDELEDDVQTAVKLKQMDDTKVSHYRVICRNDKGDYEMSQWVDGQRLPKEFDGKWTEEKLPYRVLTWDLADEADYATGLVEEYVGDLEAMSTLSESVVDGSILGAEVRYMVNPTGQTQAKDLSDSKNGDALPGKAEDVTPVQGGNPNAITVADNVLQRYERRISLGFLMQSGVTRNAERVTAEEIRLTANELETAFGGVYSTLANGIQGPMANWLLNAVGTSLAGTDLKVAVITGLDALSRNGDLENLRLAFQDLAQATAVPEQLQARLKFTPLAKFVGNGRGIDLMPYLKTDEEFAAEQQAMQQARVAEANATEAGKASAQQEAQ